MDGSGDLQFPPCQKVLGLKSVLLVSILPLGNLFHFYFSLLKANLLSVLGPCHTKFRLEFDEFSHSHVFGPRGGGT
jgi:hypothetical protein